MILNVMEMKPWLEIVLLVVQIIAFIFTPIFYFVRQAVEKGRDRKIANREVYQNLEMASMELFRFEADHIELIRPIWEKGKLIASKDTAEYIATMNYIAQMLNLFEQAIKFRKDGTMPKDIFGSWVAWFYTLVRAPGFPVAWTDLKWDYLPELRKIMNGGIQLIEEEKGSEEQKIKSKFYEFVSHILQCEIIKNWTDDSEDNSLDDYWKKRNQPETTVNKIDHHQVEIRWLTPETSTETLISLFTKNSQNQYISHKEIQEGRAINEREWAKNVEDHLANEFEAALKNELYTSSNLVGAFFEGKLIGFLFLEYTHSPNGVFATVSDIIVDKDFRKNKIGEKLVKWVTSRLKENNILRLYAESNYKNRTAHHFLESLGFKTISTVFYKNF